MKKLCGRCGAATHRIIADYLRSKYVDLDNIRLTYQKGD